MKIRLFEASACTNKTQQQLAALFEQLSPGRRQLLSQLIRRVGVSETNIKL